MSLVSKDEPLEACMPRVGYLILKALEDCGENHMTLGAMTAFLKKKEVVQYRPIMFALIFLHVAGIIDFHAPHIYLMKLPRDVPPSPSSK